MRIPIISKLFKKKLKADKTKYRISQEVSFTDLSGKQMIMTIEINGNDTLLKIHDKDNNGFALDKESSLLLSVLLQSYAAHDVFPDLDENK